MKQFSDIHYTILGLLSTCGWVSLPLLELLDYDYTYRTRALKTLLEGQYIRKSGKGGKKAKSILGGRGCKKPLPRCPGWTVIS